jgi:hypothetical protein
MDGWAALEEAEGAVDGAETVTVCGRYRDQGRDAIP